MKSVTSLHDEAVTQDQSVQYTSTGSEIKTLSQAERSTAAKFSLRDSLPSYYTFTWVLSARLPIDPAMQLALNIQLCSHILKLNVIHIFQ